MTSIMTNAAAITAVDRLRSTGHDLETTQGRVSTGLRVNTAQDNAAYWSITTTMSDDKAMATVEDALSLGAANVDVTYMGMREAIDVMKEFKSKLVAAREPGVDRDKINSEMVQLRAQMRSIAESATFNGQNWLITENSATETSREIVTSFIRGDDGSVRVGTMTYGPGQAGEHNRLIDETSPGTGAILTEPGVGPGWDVSIPSYVFMTGKDPWPLAREMGVDSTTTNTEIDTQLDGIEYMERQMIEAAANLGAMSTRIQSQLAMVQDFRDAGARGVGQLRDADMNQESARLKALQTRQQLGLQSLSIANSNTDNVRTLFG